jgi:hypothetical protein
MEGSVLLKKSVIHTKVVVFPGEGTTKTLPRINRSVPSTMGKPQRGHQPQNAGRGNFSGNNKSGNFQPKKGPSNRGGQGGAN